VAPPGTREYPNTEAATWAALRALRAEAQTDTDLSANASVHEVLSALEYFLPAVLRTEFPSWQNESLDGIFPVRSLLSSPKGFEVFGLGLLISDQSLTPLFASVFEADEQRIAYVSCMIGELNPGTDREMLRIPYSGVRVGDELRRLRARTSPITWAFRTTCGVIPNTNSNLHVVSTCCPVGCGCDVVVLRSLVDASLFCFCSSCGCAWATAQEAQFGAGLQAIDGVEKFAPSGVGIPTVGQLSTHALAGAVIRTVAMHAWGMTIDDLNDRIMRNDAHPAPTN